MNDLLVTSIWNGDSFEIPGDIVSSFYDMWFSTPRDSELFQI